MGGGGGSADGAGGEGGGRTDRGLLESKVVHPALRNMGAPDTRRDREGGGAIGVVSSGGGTGWTGKGGAGLTGAQPERFESPSEDFGAAVTAAQPAPLNPPSFVSCVGPASLSVGAKTGAGLAVTGFAILMP